MIKNIAGTIYQKIYIDKKPFWQNIENSKYYSDITVQGIKKINNIKQSTIFQFIK